MYVLTSSVLAAIVLAYGMQPGPAPTRPIELAQNVQKYWVYCIDDKTSVEQWDLEQMKARRGSDVCQLHEDTSVSGATDWMNRNFPSGTCSC